MASVSEYENRPAEIRRAERNLPPPLPDAEIPSLFTAALIEACAATGIPLSEAECADLAQHLVSTAKEVVRRKRPVHRPENFSQKSLELQTRWNEETRSQATKHQQSWTSKEVDVLQTGLSDKEAAAVLGRTLYAVKTKRKKMRAAEKATS